MRTATNILITLVLGLLVVMASWQEADVKELKIRTSQNEFRSHNARQWALSSFHALKDIEGGLDSLKGGLDSLKGGLDSLSDDGYGGLTYEQLRGPCVSIRIETAFGGGMGSGVFVSDNVVLTARHVAKLFTIGGIGAVTAYTGQTWNIVRVVLDTDNDLAAVIIDGSSDVWADLTMKRPDLGEKIICFGCPPGHLWKQHFIMTWGRVSNEKDTNNQNYILYQGLSFPGCSGGPMFLDGKLVGINVEWLVDCAVIGYAESVLDLDQEILDIL